MRTNLNYEFDRQERSKKIRRVIFEILRWLVEIAAVIAIAYLLVAYAVEQCNMIDDSMSPTIAENQTILINKITFKTRSIERYDLIVFCQTGDEHMYYDIKRVIGLPGETVKIENGEIYINGEILLEPMKVDPIVLAGFGEEGVTLDEDEYFVLGDNRNNSEDSRFSTVGNVSYDEIIGLAWIGLNPFSLVNKSNKNYVRPTPTPVGYELTATPAPDEETDADETVQEQTVTPSPTPTPVPEQ